MSLFFIIGRSTVSVLLMLKRYKGARISNKRVIKKEKKILKDI